MPKKSSPDLRAALNDAPKPRRSRPVLKLMLCPFCGRAPVARLWHGGGPDKTLIRCPAEYVGDCGGNPAITGETPKDAAKLWNTRSASAAVVQVDVIGQPHAGEGAQ